MTRQPVRTVLITADPSLREAVNGFARDPAVGISLVLDLTVTLGEFTSGQFKSVQQAAPAVVLLDFESAPDLGVSLARDLTQSGEHLAIVAVGPPLSSHMLLQALRAGVAEVLEKPLSGPVLAEAMNRLRPRLGEDADGGGAGGGRILSLFSAKGGSGSTTAVVNLGVALHRLTGKRTLVVDLDAELGEVAVLLGVQPQFNFVDLVENFHRMDANLLSSYIEQHPCGIHILSAPFHPDRAAGISAEQIRRILFYLRGQYDFILLDTSKSFSPETLAAFEQSEHVFLLATVDLPSLRNIQRAIPMLKRVMPEGLSQVHLVVNRYEPNNEISLKDVQRSLDLPVFATIANDYESVIRSINSGKPVVLGSPRSAYAKDINAMAGKIAGVEAPATTASDPSGVFARLFRRGAAPAATPAKGEMKHA